MGNEKQYDAWLHWHITRVCDLNCEYCFSKSPLKGVKIENVDIEKITRTLDKTEKIFRISFTGGEPFLIPNFIELLKALSNKHYLSFNSNITNQKINNFVDLISPDRVLNIHASFHYQELLLKNKLDTFIANYKELHERGFNIYAEQVAHPNLLNMVEKIKRIFLENNWDFRFGVYFGKAGAKKYPQDYTKEEIEKFELDISELKKFNQKNNICNAGYNAAVVFSNGDIYPCFQIKNKIGNIFEKINFDEKLIRCSFKSCGCPLNVYDEYLFNKAKRSI